MMAAFDRYHGSVLRQILVTKGRTNLSVVDVSGHVDTFSADGAAFQIKHSAKRLSPWQFTYYPQNLLELNELSRRFAPVWAFLVCGDDGIVGLSLQEIASIVPMNTPVATGVRVSRTRNSMYHVSGAQSELKRAKRRGVGEFVDAITAGREVLTECAP
jgi:hypothetical protein